MFCGSDVMEEVSDADEEDVSESVSPVDGLAAAAQDALAKGALDEDFLVRSGCYSC